MCRLRFLSHPVHLWLLGLLGFKSVEAVHDSGGCSKGKPRHMVDRKHKCVCGGSVITKSFS